MTTRSNSRFAHLLMSKAYALMPVVALLALCNPASGQAPVPTYAPVPNQAPARTQAPLGAQLPVVKQAPVPAAQQPGAARTFSNLSPIGSSPAVAPGIKLPQKAQVSPADEAWARLQKAGTEAIDSGRYGDAERTLKQAVIKSAVFGDKDIRYARSLDELARLYTIRGRFGEAEPLLEEALRTKELAIDGSNGELIPSLGHMINFYLEHGNAAKAAPLADKLLEFVEGRINEHRTAAQGPVTLKKGQPLTGWAGTAAVQMRDPLIEWAITCDAIGNQFRTRGDFDIADRLFKAALDVKETVLGKEHLSLANSFDSIGTICMDKNDDAEAENLYRYALEHTQRVLPDDFGKIYPRMDKLAKILIKEKKYEEAEQLYLRAIEYYKKEPTKNGSEARTYFALGNLYVVEKKYEQAVPMLKEALARAEEFYGPNSASLLPFLQRSADVMYYLGQNEERVRFKSRADTIAGVAEPPVQ